MVKKEGTKIAVQVKKEAKREDDELKPGQKFATPTPGFADRVFYETLLRQRPDSEMAQEWCVNFGVLPIDEAIKLNENVLQRKKKNGSTNSPAKAESAASTKTKVSKKQKTNDIIMDDIPVDSGMQIGGSEGIGTAVF